MLISSPIRPGFDPDFVGAEDLRLNLDKLTMILGAANAWVQAFYIVHKWLKSEYFQVFIGEFCDLDQ